MSDSLGGVAQHYCGGNCGEYDCPGCERSVPNCFGAHDELLELCDDCACAVWAAREKEQAARPGSM